jgi:hypothetical protein
MARLIAATRKGHLLRSFLVAIAAALFAPAAQAQVGGTTPVGAANPYPDFFDIATPGRFSLTLYGGGFLSDQYGTTQQAESISRSSQPPTSISWAVTMAETAITRTSRATFQAGCSPIAPIR